MERLGFYPFMWPSLEAREGSWGLVSVTGAWRSESLVYLFSGSIGFSGSSQHNWVSLFFLCVHSSHHTHTKCVYILSSPPPLAVMNTPTHAHPNTTSLAISYRYHCNGIAVWLLGSTQWGFHNENIVCMQTGIFPFYAICVYFVRK